MVTPIPPYGLSMLGYISGTIIRIGVCWLLSIIGEHHNQVIYVQQHEFVGLSSNLARNKDNKVNRLKWLHGHKTEHVLIASNTVIN